MPYKCRGCSKEYKTKTPFIKHEKECNTNVKLSNAISMSHYKKYTDELEYMEKDRLQRMAALKQLQKQNDERNLRHKSQTQTPTAGALDVEAAIGEIIQTQTQTQTQTQNEVQLTDIKDAENYANQFATPGTRYTLAQSTNMAGPRFTITTSTTSVSPGQQNINMKITPTLCHVLQAADNAHAEADADADDNAVGDAYPYPGNTRGTQTSLHDIPRQPYDPNNRPVLSKEGIVLEKDWEKHLANIGEEDADGVITFEKMTLLVLALIEKNKELQADNDAMKLEMVKFEIIKKALIGTLGSK
jgi:hypothetical protein